MTETATNNNLDPLALVFADPSSRRLSRDDLLKLAAIQFRAAADAVDAGETAAGRAFGLDALGFIERARVAG